MLIWFAPSIICYAVPDETRFHWTLLPTICSEVIGGGQQPFKTYFLWTLHSSDTHYSYIEGQAGCQAEAKSLQICHAQRPVYLNHERMENLPVEVWAIKGWCWEGARVGLMSNMSEVNAACTCGKLAMLVKPIAWDATEIKLRSHFSLPDLSDAVMSSCLWDCKDLQCSKGVKQQQS